LGQFFPIKWARTTSLELPADGGRAELKQPSHLKDADHFIHRRGFILPHRDLKILPVDMGKVFSFLAFLDILAVAHVNDVFIVIPSYRVLMSFSVSLHSATRGMRKLKTLGMRKLKTLGMRKLKSKYLTQRFLHATIALAGLSACQYSSVGRAAVS
jgi:hypothetical protein